MFIIHTPTIEDYREIVRYAIDRDIIWKSGHICIFESYWENNNRRQETCIVIDNYNRLSCSNRKDVAETRRGIPVLDKHKFYYEMSREFGKVYGLK